MGTYTGLCEVKAVVCAESRRYVLSRVRKRPFVLPGSVMAINTFVGTSQSSVCAVGLARAAHALSHKPGAARPAGVRTALPCCPDSEWRLGETGSHSGGADPEPRAQERRPYVSSAQARPAEQHGAYTWDCTGPSCLLRMRVCCFGHRPECGQYTDFYLKK